MRAKILMLSDSVKSKALLRTPQQALNDMAVAFGHSFIMKDQPLDNGNLDLEDYQGTLVAASEEVLLGVFDAKIRVSTLALPGGLTEFSLLKTPSFPVISVVTPVDQDLETASKAALTALQKAGETGEMVWAVKSGSKIDLIGEAIQRVASPYAFTVPEAVSLAQVIYKPMQFPDRQHIFLADHASADILLGLFHGLAVVGLCHTIYYDDNYQVYRPGGVPGLAPRLFDALYATVAMLEEGLRLKKEAGCLQASVDNVLASGWRARDMDIVGEMAGDDQISELIGEQIELAGSLMQRFPG